MSLSDSIRAKAIELGFDLVGIAPAGRSRHADAFRAWIGAGRHAGMDWLARDPETRADTRRALPGAASVIAVGVTYFVRNPPPEIWNDPSRGRIARYAWGQDYHAVLRPRLEALAGFIHAEAGSSTQTRTFLDSEPLLERSVAEQAGLGFIGHSNLLISPEFGSYVFLGEILTNLELEDLDKPGVHSSFDRCGDCRACLAACPTGALVAEHVLDARRCISYLTVENRGPIPEEFRPLMGHWIFGCDACQEVCPWVERCSKPKESFFLDFDPDFAAPRLLPLLDLDEAAFRARYFGSPVMRARRSGFLRNVCVALGNWGSREALPALEKAARDPWPLVREHAQWAIKRIVTCSQ